MLHLYSSYLLKLGWEKYIIRIIYKLNPVLFWLWAFQFNAMKIQPKFQIVYVQVLSNKQKKMYTILKLFLICKRSTFNFIYHEYSQQAE